MLEHMDAKDYIAQAERLYGKKRKAPENKVKAACRGWLKLHKIPHNRQQCGMIKAINPKTGKQYFVHLADEGAGDLVGCNPYRNGQFFEIETKDVKGNQRDGQILNQKKVEAAGGMYILAKSIDDLKPLLAKL